MAFALFADFTTETTTHQYWYNGTQYANASAWLTAISGTFSRSSVGYYTNSSGLLASASNNVLRFDYDPVLLTPKGVLLEGSGTNIAIRSGDVGNAAAWQNGVGVTVASNAYTAPDGTTTMGSVTASSGNSSHVARQSITTSSATYTFSTYFRYVNNQWVGLMLYDGTNLNIAIFDILNGVTGNTSGAGFVSSKIKATGQSGVFLCQVTATMASSGSSLIDIILQNANAANESAWTAAGTEAVGAWGMQVEQSSFATSYIPTTSGTASRSADSLSATPISSWFNSSVGVLYAAGDSYSNPANGVGLIDIDDGSNNNRADLRISSSGTMALVVSGGVNQFAPSVSDSGQVANSTGVLSRIAANLQAGNFIYVKDAGTADSLSSGSMPVSPTTLNIGSVALGSLPLFGRVQQIGYWPVAASSTQLQTLTGSPANVGSINLPTQNVTNTAQRLQLPINCIIAGQQIEEIPKKYSVDMFGILKRIFRE